MPELPDITVYIEALERHVLGQPLEEVRILSPFILRTVEPTLDAFTGKRVTGIRRMGKRIVLAFDDDLFVVLHLMIAGRLRWLDAKGKIPGKIALATFKFPTGTLLLTE